MQRGWRERRRSWLDAKIATLADLMAVLRTSDDAALRAHFDAVKKYRERYGAA